MERFQGSHTHASSMLESCGYRNPKAMLKASETFLWVFWKINSLPKLVLSSYLSQQNSSNWIMKPQFSGFFHEKKIELPPSSFTKHSSSLRFYGAAFFRNTQMLEKKSSVENPLPNQKGFHAMCICNYIYIYFFFLPVYFYRYILRKCYCIMLYNMFAYLFLLSCHQNLHTTFHCIVSLLSVATNAMQSSDDSHPCSPIVGETAKCE